MANRSYRDTSARRIYLSLLRILLSLRGGRWLRHFFAALSRLGVFQKSYRFGFTVPNVLWQSWGYSREEMQRDAWEKALHPDDHDMVMIALQRQMAAGDVIELPEYRILTRDGKTRWVLSKGVVVERDRDGRIAHYIGADFDITRRKQAEARVTLLLREKERLLRETRHRTANQILAIEAVLSGAADQSDDESPARVLERARKRLGAMRRVNALLSRAIGPGPVRLRPLLEETVDAVSTLWDDGVSIAGSRGVPGAESSSVSVTLDPAALEIDGSRATVLALAANEALTNAYRHGLGDGEIRGTIHVHTRRIHGRQVELLVTSPVSRSQTESPGGAAESRLSEDEYGLGLSVIRDTVADYGGELSIHLGKTTSFRVVLPEN